MKFIVCKIVAHTLPEEWPDDARGCSRNFRQNPVGRLHHQTADRLADIFTPLCLELADVVEAMPPEAAEYMVQECQRQGYPLLSPFPEIIFRQDEMDDTIFEYFLGGIKTWRNQKSFFDTLLMTQVADADVKFNLWYGYTAKQRKNFSQLLRRMRINTGQKIERRLYFPYASGINSAFVWVHYKNAVPFVSVMMMPIGAYGSLFARKVLMSATLMNMTASVFLNTPAYHVAAEHTQVIRQATARGKDQEIEKAPLATVQEGVMSIMNSIALLSAEAPAHFSDPDDLMKAVIEAQLPTKLSQIVPAGMVGPLAFRGRYFPKVLEAAGGKNVCLSSPFLDLMDACKAVEKRWVSDHLKCLETDHFHIPRGVTCPVGYARPGFDAIGLHALSRSFLKVYRLLGTMPLFQNEALPLPSQIHLQRVK